jgi:hypothetical protein
MPNKFEDLMKCIGPFIFAFVIFNACVAAFAENIPLEEAMAAYKNGQYALSLHLFWPLAEQGDVNAQLMVGSMLSEGKDGVPQSLAQALVWYRKRPTKEVLLVN